MCCYIQNFTFENLLELSLVAHVCDPTALGAEAGGSKFKLSLGNLGYKGLGTQIIAKPWVQY